MSAASPISSELNSLCYPEVILEKVNNKLTANTIVITITAVALVAIGMTVLLVTHAYFPSAFIFSTIAIGSIGWSANGLFFAQQYAERQALSSIKSREETVIKALSGDTSDPQKVLAIRVQLASKQFFTLLVENAREHFLNENKVEEEFSIKKAKALEAVARKLGMNLPGEKSIVEITEQLEEIKRQKVKLFCTAPGFPRRPRTFKEIESEFDLKFDSISPSRLTQVAKKALEVRYLREIQRRPDITTTLDEAGIYYLENASQKLRDLILMNQHPFAIEYGHEVNYSNIVNRDIEIQT